MSVLKSRVIFAVCLTTLFLAVSAGAGTVGNEGGLVGKNAPIFSSVDLQGNPVKLEELIRTSSLVVLNFWGVRCASCLEEMPYLSEIHRKFAPRQVTILGVNVDGMDREKLKELLPQVSAVPPYTLVVDREFAVTDLYGVSAAPLTLVVLPDGKVAYQHEGFTAGDEKKLEEEIVKDLGKAAGGK